METSSQNNKGSIPNFLSGGGEMGQLIREKDWSKTSLGDPEDWPQSLRTMVAVMLDNPFGMYIAWGNEYIQLYNDGYRPILGSTKHPQALGTKTEDTFEEIWHIVGPMFDDVMKGHAFNRPDFMYELNRNGFVEECYFDFAYSPIRKENGEVGGVLVTVIETTAKKIAIEALKESNARFTNNIMQAPVAMCIFRGAHYVVEIANAQMLELWGKQAEQVINKPIFEGLPEAQGQGLEPLLYNVFTTGEKFVANERPVNLPRNGKMETTYINFVYEALKQPDGTVSGILATAIEVTPQVISRSRIEESEQKVRALVENAPFPIAVYVGKEMIVELANQSIIDIWGKGNDVIGKSFRDVLPELDNQLVFEQIEKVLETGESFHTKNTPLDLIIDGKPYTYYFNYSFTPLYDISGNIYGVMNTGVDLTDLNIAKRKIEESDKRFRNTVKQAPVGMTILRGPEYIVEMANDAYLHLVDRTEDKFVGQPLFESLPEVRETVNSLLDSVLNTGVPYRGNEVPIPVNRYGKLEVSYFDFLYYPLKEEDGKISGVIVTVTEVSENVEARKKTEQNEERLNIVVEASELGTYELNLKTDEVIYSDKYLKIFGFDKGIVPTHNELINRLHPTEMQMRNRAYKDSLVSGTLFYQAKVVWSDKSIHWIEVKGKVFYDDEKKPVKLIGTVGDITEEKNHEQELKESEQKFRLLADSMPQQIWTSDIDGNLNYFNRSVFDYSGLTLEQINKDGWIQIVHPDDREENIKEWIKSVSTGKDFMFEHRFRRYDGAYRWQLSRAIPQRDSSGNIQMWVGTSTDIQDKKAVEAQLDKLVKERTVQLERSNEDLQQFAHVASHDLKEPVRKIMTFCNRLIDEFQGDIPVRGREYIEKIERASKRMTAMIEGVLTYSSINAMEQTIEPVDLNGTMNNIISDLEVIIQKKGADIRMENLPTIEGADVLIYQLFYNLINNSLKFSKPDEAPFIAIKSSFMKDNGRAMACITVTDNGIGFQNESSEKIFNTFARLNSKDKFEGTGLGLALCKKIVERHSGFITAKGEKNSGATFTILLPLKQHTKNI